jgi:hypothetical protein
LTTSSRTKSCRSGARYVKRSSPFDRNRTKSAKQQGRLLANTYHLWFRDKYRLAPTDPRFLAATDEQIEAEFWAYQYQSNKAKEEVEDDDFDLSDVLAGFERNATTLPMQQASQSVKPNQATTPVDAVSDWEEVDLG